MRLCRRILTCHHLRRQETAKAEVSGSSQEHTAAVGLSGLDAILNADALGGGTEVMVVDVGVSLLSFHSWVLEVTDQLPLLASMISNGLPRFSN
jgi:hypothetical protein